ncbi:hypothetical protein [Lacinutrix undariae]
MKNNQYTILFLTLTLLIFTNCGLTGDEVARLSINQASTDSTNTITRTTTLHLKKGETIAFWSQMDFKYTNNVNLNFKVNVLKDKKPYTQLDINPIKKNITINEVKKVVNNNVTWRFKGKNTTLQIIEDGTYTFNAYVLASKNPTLQITKAELILKK